MIIMITNTNGNVGRTTISKELAALFNKNENYCAIPFLSLDCGYEIINSKTDLSDFSLTKTINRSISKGKKQLGINTNVDIVVIDGTYSEHPLYDVAIAASDFVIVPCDSSDESIHGVYEINERINQLNKTNMCHTKLLGIVLNKYKPNAEGISTSNKLEKMTHEFDNAFFTKINYSQYVEEAKQNDRSLSEYCAHCTTAQQFRQLADMIEQRIFK